MVNHNEIAASAPVSDTLREARRTDVAAIQRIRGAVRENRLTSRTISDEEVVEAIEQTGCGWVVESQGAVVAFAIGNATDGSVWALFVDPDHEGRGYGRRLHDAMIAWFWSQGHARLWLSTEPGTRAESFYRRAGWQDMGLLPSGERQFELTRSADRT
jgi:GNAT superfamily N-acetyltransferase